MQRVLEALFQGDYDTAFETLNRSLAVHHGEAARPLFLLLAEAYTLYEEGGQKEARLVLEQAVQQIPALRGDPLYQALVAEVRALEGATTGELAPYLTAGEEIRVRYHQAQTLLYLGEAEKVLQLCYPLEGLPPFLRWRGHNLRARAFEQLEELENAAREYSLAARHSVGLERYWNLLDEAAMWVEVGQGEPALAALDRTREVVIPGSHTQIGYEDPNDGATRYYLQARAHLLLDNPGLALLSIQKAMALEADGAEPSQGAPLVQGEALMQLGQFDRAVDAFRLAAERAEGSDQSYALHEMGTAALEAGQYVEAENALKKTVQDPDYIHHAAAWADLAEVLYRRNLPEAARQAAQHALEAGETTSSHVVLGHLAYDLMQYEEALEQYDLAVRSAEAGSRDWIAAQELWLEVMAQLGYRDPAAVLERVDLVLPYLTQHDEWRATLEQYADRARSQLGGRTLN